MKDNKQCLKPCAFGCALGLIWGLGMLLLGWLGWLFNCGLPMIHVFGSVYYGFSPSFWGGVLGGLWGAVDFFIFGALVAWVYNCCLCCCCPRSAAKSDQSGDQNACHSSVAADDDLDK